VDPQALAVVAAVIAVAIARSGIIERAVSGDRQGTRSDATTWERYRARKGTAAFDTGAGWQTPGPSIGDRAGRLWRRWRASRRG
jgi:hypothetical protein